MQKRIITAVEKAQRILAKYAMPGKHNCEKTIDELFGVLDNRRLVDALSKHKSAAKKVRKPSKKRVS